MSKVKSTIDWAHRLKTISSIGLLIAVFAFSSFLSVGFSLSSQADSTSIEATGFAESIASVQGTVTATDQAYSTVVYTVDEKEYEFQVNAVSDFYPVGSEVEVLYNTEKPEDVRVPSIFVTMFNKMGKKYMRNGFIVSGSLLAVSVILFLISRAIKNINEKTF